MFTILPQIIYASYWVIIFYIKCPFNKTLNHVLWLIEYILLAFKEDYLSEALLVNFLY